MVLKYSVMEDVTQCVTVDECVPALRNSHLLFHLNPYFISKSRKLSKKLSSDADVVVSLMKKLLNVCGCNFF